MISYDLSRMIYLGASFTRFQTLRLQKVFPTVLSDKLISYGPCQFPTLGFVVERFKAREAFIPEPFWKIEGIGENMLLTIISQIINMRLSQ